MKAIKKIIFTFMLLITGLANFSVFNLVSAQKTPYDGILRITTDDRSLASAIDGGDVLDESSDGGYWAKLFNEQVIYIISYAIDFFIVIWIAVAFFGAYKIMVSDKEETLKEWVRLVIFWILWIIIMVSARFIATSLVWDDGTGWIIWIQFANPDPNYKPNWIIFADDLYQKIMYPFIKIALYFVIWILFFILIGKVISFVTSTDDSVKKKAWWIIIWCVVWILIVMWAKQVVEAVIWKQNDVLKIPSSWPGKSATPLRIDEQWNPILEFGSIPLIAQIINWVMGLTMLIILIIIIILWYKIFTKPDDPKTRQSVKKGILYIIIWILVIGAAYVISNFLVINNVPTGVVATEG